MSPRPQSHCSGLVNIFTVGHSHVRYACSGAGRRARGFDPAGLRGETKGPVDNATFSSNNGDMIVIHSGLGRVDRHRAYRRWKHRHHPRHLTKPGGQPGRRRVLRPGRARLRYPCRQEHEPLLRRLRAHRLGALLRQHRPARRHVRSPYPIDPSKTAYTKLVPADLALGCGPTRGIGAPTASDSSHLLDLMVSRFGRKLEGGRVGGGI